MSAPGPVLVTRAEPGASETMARLAALGYAPISTPVLVIEPTEADLGLAGVAGLIFTSANGVRVFADRSRRRDLAAWCVGPATTDAARAAGFRRVVDADGDARALARRIRADADPSAGPLLHVANDAAAGELVSTLREAGFDARFAPLYRAARAPALAAEALNALAAGPAAVLIHSAKGAEAFAALAPADLSGVVAVAVSERAAAPLKSRGVARLAWADKPNEDALLAALQRAWPLV